VQPFPFDISRSLILIFDFFDFSPLPPVTRPIRLILGNGLPFDPFFFKVADEVSSFDGRAGRVLLLFFGFFPSIILLPPLRFLLSLSFPTPSPRYPPLSES